MPQNRKLLKLLSTDLRENHTTIKTQVTKNTFELIYKRKKSHS